MSERALEAGASPVREVRELVPDDLPHRRRTPRRRAQWSATPGASPEIGRSPRLGFARVGVVRRDHQWRTSSGRLSHPLTVALRLGSYVQRALRGLDRFADQLTPSATRLPRQPVASPRRRAVLPTRRRVVLPTGRRAVLSARGLARRGPRSHGPCRAAGRPGDRGGERGDVRLSAPGRPQGALCRTGVGAVVHKRLMALPCRCARAARRTSGAVATGE